MSQAGGGAARAAVCIDFMSGGWWTDRSRLHPREQSIGGHHEHAIHAARRALANQLDGVLRPQPVPKIAERRAGLVVRALGLEQEIGAAAFCDQEIDLPALLIANIPEREVAVPEVVPGIHEYAEPDGRTELRRPKTPLVASVGYFPERYGDALIRLALDILGGKAVPPAVFIKHQVITRENVDHFYPNDALTQISPSY